MGAAARSIAAYSSWLKSIISSDRPPMSPAASGKSAMQCEADAGGAFARRRIRGEVLGCEAAAVLLPLLTDFSWLFITGLADLGLALGGVDSTAEGVLLTLLLLDPAKHLERGFAARLSLAGQPA